MEFPLIAPPVVSTVCLQVESEDKFERIGGSSIGGGTFWGLGALLTKTKVIILYFFFSFEVVFAESSSCNCTIPPLGVQGHSLK